MSDYSLERLRDYAGRWIPLSTIDDGTPVIGETRLALMALRAADEIERLRAEVTRLRHDNATSDTVRKERAEVENENLRLTCAALDAAITESEASAAARMQERDECRRLLREACIGYEHNYNELSGDKRLRLVPIFHTWYERAARAAGGGE